MLFTLASIASAYSQDMISLRNGEKIKANVKEVSDSEVVFTYDKETVINKLPTAQIAQSNSNRVGYKNLRLLITKVVITITLKPTPY